MNECCPARVFVSTNSPVNPTHHITVVSQPLPFTNEAQVRNEQQQTVTGQDNGQQTADSTQQTAHSTQLDQNTITIFCQKPTVAKQATKQASQSSPFRSFLIFMPSTKVLDITAYPQDATAAAMTATQTTGPTLLPTPVASIVSLISKSTSVSIRLGTIVGATLLDTARSGSLAGLEISRAAVEGIVRRGSHGVVVRRGREAAELEGWAEKGMSTFNTSISLAELIISTAFELGQTTLSSISGIVETSILTVDSIFGSTETSRAINEIVKLVRQEFKDSSEHDGEVGMKDIAAGLTCFAILQYRTRIRLEEDSGRLMWDVVIDAIPTQIVKAEATSSQQNSDIPPTGNNILPPVVFDNFPANAEISISTTSTTTNVTTIEVVGTNPPDFTPPPGAVVLSESSHHDGRQRYKIVYETVTRSEQSKRLKREDGGEVETLGEDIEMVDAEPRVFEIEEPQKQDRSHKSHRHKHEKYDKHAERRKRRELKTNESRPSGSDTDRPRPVPKKTRIDTAIEKTSANQHKKRSTSTPATDKKIKEKDRKQREKEVPQEKERERSARDNHRDLKSSLRRALSPPVNCAGGTKDKKHASSTPRTPRSRRPSITSTSRPPSPPGYDRRSSYHRRESFSSTTSHHDTHHGVPNLQSPQREAPALSRSASIMSLTSYADEEHHTSTKHGYAPSIYTLHTSHSTASLQMLSYQPPTSEDPGPCYPSDFHIIHNMRKYITFAAASYGAQFMKLIFGSNFHAIPMPEVEHHYEHLAFSHHTSLPVDTILLSSHYDPSGGFDSAGHTGTGRPLVHFVCVDHEARAIVVTCRGTLGLEDALVDLTCEYTTITLRGQSYRVHKGMFNSAILLLHSKLLHNLASALNQYPNYGLVLTGHSLGGGVAALVSILISAPHETRGFVTSHPDLPADRPVHCYAYGSPAIVCEALRKSIRGLVTSIVNGNDVVPSLSIGVVRDFHSVAVSFREDNSGVLAEVRRRIIRGLWGARNNEEEWNWEVAVLKTLRASMRAEKLVPPGEVWRVMAEDTIAKSEVAGGKKGKKRVRAWVVEDVQGRFGELRFTRGCFGDHHPASYEEALEGLRRGVLEA
ncbi:hypothetical protein BZA77DRAFT_344139 [Pyronema omphalodes]|nr:hypothetical protein BZA77DRAFT_344139 [Pyronema omphalodes]